MPGIEDFGEPSPQGEAKFYWARNVTIVKLIWRYQNQWPLRNIHFDYTLHISLTLTYI
jgi:hypothetical protein